MILTILRLATVGPPLGRELYVLAPVFFMQISFLMHGLTGSQKGASLPPPETSRLRRTILTLLAVGPPTLMSYIAKVCFHAKFTVTENFSFSC